MCRSCKASPACRARSRAAADHRRSAGCATSGPVLVGAGGRREPRLGDDHRAGDFFARRLAAHAGPGLDRRNRHLHQFRHHADRAARTAVGFINFLFQQSAKLSEFFAILDTHPAIADSPDAQDRRPAQRRAWPSRTSAFPMTASAWRCATSAFRRARRDHRAGRRRPARANRRRSACCIACSIRSRARHDRRRRHPRFDARIAATQHRRRVSGADAVRPLDRGQSAHRQAGRDASGDRSARSSGRRPAVSSRAKARASQTADRRARPRSLGRRAPAPLHRPRAAERPADHGVRRSHQRARRHHRAADSKGAGSRHQGPHDLRDRASARDRAHADRILVFDNGEIVESGSFENWWGRAGVSQRWRRRSC